MFISRPLDSVRQVESVRGLIYLSLRSYCSTEMKKGEQEEETPKQLNLAIQLLQFTWLFQLTLSVCCTERESEFGNINSTDRCAMLISSSSNTPVDSL